MGRPAWILRACLHWPSGDCVIFGYQSRWSLSCQRRSVNYLCLVMYKERSTPNISLGEDLAINLWDLGSGKRIKKMTGHTASIYSLAFSAESSLLVSGGADWTVRCWDVKGAGGSPDKPRENGVNGYTPMGLARTSAEAATVREYGEGNGMETYVVFHSQLDILIH